MTILFLVALFAILMRWPGAIGGAGFLLFLAIHWLLTEWRLPCVLAAATWYALA